MNLNLPQFKKYVTSVVLQNSRTKTLYYVYRSHVVNIFQICAPIQPCPDLDVSSTLPDDTEFLDSNSKLLRELDSKAAED